MPIFGKEEPEGVTVNGVPLRCVICKHDAVRQWCVANHRALAGPSWETYGHWQTEWDRNPSLIRTDVFYQVID